MSDLVTIKKGTLVGHNGKLCKVLAPVGSQQIMLELPDSSVATADICDIRSGSSIEKPELADAGHFSQVSSTSLESAVERHKIFSELVHKSDRTRADVLDAARRAGLKSAEQGYRILGKLANVGDTPVAIAAKQRGPKIGSFNVTGMRSTIMEEAIRSVYLNDRRASVKDTFDTMAANCRAANLATPSYNTLRNRILAWDQEEVALKRHGSKAAQRLHQGRPGKFPGADHALSIVQLDHTKLDIMLVDAQTRKPTTRPNITMAIDVCTRMILGFLVTYDSPRYLSTGTCIANSIFPKGKYLRGLGLEKYDWPCWGLMRMIHTDNGSDFWCKDLDKACAQYGIGHDWRLPGTPRYGGHIERFFKETNRQVHKLPGSTFSNPIDRGDYDSSGKAVLTIDELEKFLTIWICGVYHQSFHSGIGTTPQKMWEKEVKGEDGTGPTWNRQLPEDEHTARIDFLPSYTANVRRSGFRRKNREYYDPSLVNSPGDKEFKIDLNCISPMYLWNPSRNGYDEISFAHPAEEVISEYQLRDRNKKLRDERRAVNPDAIIAARAEMDAIVSSARADKKGKKARLNAERSTGDRKRRQLLNSIRPDVKSETGCKESPSTSAASARLSAGSMSRRYPARLIPMADGRTPGTDFTEPSSASSPKQTTSRKRAESIC